ncbi:MFS transporter [Bradyrhizobium sp. I71]|jgi:predicted MFS family arabinose efflux permease|uniref:MFS transporter n=1 Tax=Bradyrhizobium sp. I71 TaxID=2590772 RepID=UPI001EF8C478|nr:MFS transporter [Bradyrhizobium sp. I71]ULL01612.1 MFS transporter [Bradyrhizobium sp. I71]
MLSVLANRTYRHLFAAQVIALIGTGLMTVALGLLAFRIAGENAGAVLGTALAIKMVAYVLVAPVVGGLAGRLPRRTFLVAMDLTRAGVAIALPFIDQVWEVYVLIFVLQSASAAFTPTFQATIPDVLPEERDYTRALSLSRLAYDLESLLSPTLAAALLTLVTFNWLFFGTVIGFFCSAALVVSVTIPQAAATRPRRGFYEDTTGGMRIYLAAPRLRGLLALNLSVAAAGSMVFVNTVVLVKGALGGTDGNVAVALACFGGGSMAAALLLPRLLDRLPDRRIMLSSAEMLAAVLAAFGAIMVIYGNEVVRYALLPTWVLLGIGYSGVMTPAGRLLRRSAGAADRPAVFAAQFALSHLCWLLTYPLAGWLGLSAGIAPTALVLATLTLSGVVLAFYFWPVAEPDPIPHDHPEVPPDHPHLRGQPSMHAHAYVLDDLHPRWP